MSAVGAGGRRVFVPGEEDLPREAGGKAAGLERLGRLGEPVPPWIVVLASPGPEPCSPALRSEVLAALECRRLLGARLAVRSSAAAEDGAKYSFAGQFRTVLNVPAADAPPLWEAIDSVCRSADTESVRDYERTTGALGGERLGVILQELVDAAASGVAFSVDPVNDNRDTAVVSAVHGLGEGLVSGSLEGDTYWVGPDGCVTRNITRKAHSLRLASEGGTRLEPVPDSLQSDPALSDAEAGRVAACVRRVAAALGCPQDLEFALVEGEDPAHDRRLLVLQSRPITTLAPKPAPAALSGQRKVWDNSNIIESYHGPTTPLTFSFVRGVYEQAYLQLCRVFGVEESLLRAHHEVFANMVGLVRGRIYYDLLNWYRALSLLPGYGVNRAFMERMMGVREKLADPPSAPYTPGKLRDALRLSRMILRLLREYRRHPEEIARFHARVDAELAPLAGQDLTRLPIVELVRLYLRLEAELLDNWKAPLVNDFFAMIAFGACGRLIEKWLPGAPPTLLNDLLGGEGGIISTEPARRVAHLADEIRESPLLTELFAGDDAAIILSRLRTDPQFEVFQVRLTGYLERFGERCANELKLETVTIAEDPAYLVHMLQRYLAAPPALRPAGVGRDEAESRLSALPGLRRRVVSAVLAATRRRVRDRENLRFERTRVFGVARRIFLAIGAHLAAEGRLDSPRDVFFLTREEVLALTTPGGEALRARVLERRSEYEAFTQEPPPPDRIEAGVPPEASSGHSPSGAGELRGTGCCAGVVEGPVRLVRDPAEAGDLHGCILVAERTDPGWTLLFPLARGLLVQRGSLLSHSAIVAREVGLPCIVGVSGLLDTLRDGERVSMDGSTGLIRRLETPT